LTLLPPAAIFSSVRVLSLVVLIIVAIAAAFIFIPAVQGLVVPMPGTIRTLIRESEAKPPAGGVVHRDLVYRDGTFRDQHLDIYEPLAEFSGGTPPIVVFFHGGSWIHGDKITIRVVDRFLRRMREAGYFVAAVNYTTNLLRGFEGPLENSRVAMRWLAAEAPRYGYDAHNMGLYGVSAGGHLALLAVSTMEHDGFSPAFVFAECAPTDLVAMKEGEAYDHSFTFRLFSDTRLRELSPIHHIGDALPPVLLFHGGEDRTVDVRQSERYAAALEAAGRPVTLIVYPEGDHAFLNLPDEMWYRQETTGLAWFDLHFRRGSASSADAPEDKTVR
jgi:acetyl esterase/lipase